MQLRALWCLETIRRPAVAPRLLQLKYHRIWRSPSRNWRSGRCLACIRLRGTGRTRKYKQRAPGTTDPGEGHQMKHILHFRMGQDQEVSLTPIMRGKLMMKNHKYQVIAQVGEQDKNYAHNGLQSQSESKNFHLLLNQHVIIQETSTRQYRNRILRIALNKSRAYKATTISTTRQHDSI